ncbi:MAG: hypothetical protein H6704_08685 [Myxococcales bacterium]|nr:hypothetical protein [Myxococcales bacterium]
MTPIAVTGVGLVCPAGVGLEAALARLAEGPLEPTVPDGDEGAGVPEPRTLCVPADFKARDWLTRKKDLKLMARPNQLAVAAARLAVRDAGLGDADLTDAGLYLGVGREPGSVDDVLPAVAHSLVDGALSLDQLVAQGMGWMNPLSSLKTLPNMSVAHVSINLGIMGPSQALCAGPSAGSDALAEGARALLEGRADVVLAGAADARVSFGDRVSAAREGVEGPVGEAAVVLLLERLPDAQARGARVHAFVELDAPTAPAPARLFGDCGAATDMAPAVVAVARGEDVTVGGVRLRPPAARPGAPAVHVRAPDLAVAITGVGLATPLGSRFDAFRDALLAGRSAVAPIRAFDATGFPVRNACEVPDFDPAARLPADLYAAVRGQDDRKTELALAAAVDALADHGAVDAGAGVVFGTGLSSVSLAELAQDLVPFVTADHRFDYAAFGARPTPKDAQAPARHTVDRVLPLLAAHAGLGGPRHGHFSACAAGTAAIGHALDLVRRGAAPMVLAGGGDSMVHPFGLLPFILLGATSPQVDPARAGRPFDQARDGFVMGEGAAFFVLEPLHAARAAGRRVYAVVRGWGCSTDAHNVTAPHPEGAGAERAMRAALADAGLDPAAVDYINAHGTGTPLNDGIEAAAIRRVFGAKAPPVSSSKAQVGHAIAAAGAVELLACLAAFDGGRLPPTAHLADLDPAVDLDIVGPEGRAGTPRIILSNSFGFGGQNACLALAHPDLEAAR